MTVCADRPPVKETRPATATDKATGLERGGLANESSGQASVLATPIGQVMPFGPWLQ